MTIKNRKYFLFLLSVLALVAASKLYSLLIENIFYSISWKLYLCLGLLSASVVFFNESFLNIIHENKLISNFKYYIIILFCCLMFTITYGPSIFINFYKYDDWMYMSYSMSEINFTFINSTINEHYIPLLKTILYYNSIYSDPSFFGYSLILYISIMLLISALARFIVIHINDLDVLFITLIAFSIWPTFENSRTWFGGAFWLTMPLATLLVSLILVKEIVADRSPDKNSFLLAIFLFITVFISSQVLLPIIFICAYLAPYLLFKEDRISVRKYFFRITLISVVPSIITFMARPELPTKRVDLYGLIDGSILRNIFYFIDNKIFLIDKPSSTIVFFTFILFVFSFVYICFSIKSKSNFNNIILANKNILSLSLVGLCIFLIFFVQVGLGRGWEAWIVVNEYYATMPLLGLFITISTILYIIKKYIIISWHQISLLFLSLIVLLSYSFVHNYPGEKYINQIMYQKLFMQDLGKMICGKLEGVNDGSQIYLEHILPFSKLKNAEEVFRAPKTFIDSLSNDSFIMLSIKTASRECKNEIGKISTIKKLEFGDEQETNEEINFYKKYYYPN
jgi:hypothetical protein